MFKNVNKYFLIIQTFYLNYEYPDYPLFRKNNTGKDFYCPNLYLLQVDSFLVQYDSPHLKLKNINNFCIIINNKIFILHGNMS
jgi:hypothetical protein